MSQEVRVRRIAHLHNLKSSVLFYLYICMLWLSLCLQSCWESLCPGGKRISQTKQWSPPVPSPSWPAVSNTPGWVFSNSWKIWLRNWIHLFFFLVALSGFFILNNFLKVCYLLNINFIGVLDITNTTLIWSHLSCIKDEIIMCHLNE